MDLRNPAVRWGVGLSGGLMIATGAFLFFEGVAQLVLLAFAAVDVVVTPLILKYAVENQA